MRHNFIGLPEPLDDNVVIDLEEEAGDMYADEVSRTRQSSRPEADPSKKKRTIGASDLELIKASYPFLSRFSEDFIINTPLNDLLKLESTQMKLKQIDKGKDAEDRLSSNKEALSKSFTTVESGKDNRWNSIHPARFLAGAGISTTKMWLAARKSVGLRGFPAIANYDMGSLGLAGVVTAKGWIELHDPSSTKMSLKLFNIVNCTKTKNSDGGEEGSITELSEFRLALRALRTAMHHVMPWNFSVEALEGFFIQSNYCQADTGNIEKRAQFLTQFTDYVLGQNAERWRDEEPFLTTGELKTAWSTFFNVRPQVSRDRKKDQKKPEGKGPRRAAGVCWAWNEGKCLKAQGDCKTSRGYELKHICNYAVDLSKPEEICGKDHMRIKFH